MAYLTGLRIRTSIDRRVGAHLRFIAISPQVDKSIIVCDGWPALFTNPAVTCAAFNLTSSAATNLPSNTPPKRRNGRQLGWLRRPASWQPLPNGCYVSSRDPFQQTFACYRADTLQLRPHALLG